MTKSMRTVRKALGMLLVGVLLSIITGWLCGVLPDIRPSWVPASVSSFVGRWPAPAPPNWPAPDATHQLGSDIHRSWIALSHNGDFRLRAQTPDPTAVAHWMFIHEFGFPYRTLRARRLVIDSAAASTPVPVSVFYEGLQLPRRWLGPRGLANRRIAFEPLWLGLAVNSVFYGGLTWAASALFQRWRTRRRAHAGQCPHCRYTVGNLPVCPECGHSVSNSSGKPPAANEPVKV